MKMKRVFSLAMSLVMIAAVLAGCSNGNGDAASASAASGGSKSSAQPTKASIQIKYSTWASEGEAAYEGMKMFKQYVEEGSNGDIEVLLYPANQAGSTNEQVEQVSMNQLQMMSSGDPGIKELEYLCLPYLFDSLDKYMEFMESEIGQRYIQKGIDSRNTWSTASCGIRIRILCLASIHGRTLRRERWASALAHPMLRRTRSRLRLRAREATAHILTGV